MQLKVDADSRIVTHVALGDPIGSNIKIIAVDANGNTCSIRGSEDVAVYCRLLKCDDSAAAEEVEISGSQMTPMGLVLFANRNDDGTFVFPSIVLSEKIRGNASERTCGLEDVVLAIECKGFLSESPRRIPIRYYNNAAYAKKLDDIAKQHENLLGEIRAFDIEKIELKNRLNRKETEIKQLLERLKKFSTGIYPFSQEDSHGLTKASFSDYLQQSKQYVQSMEAAASQSRPAIKGSDYNNNHTLSISLNLSIPSVGVVVDLGYVLEEADARVLSWAAQQYLPAAVVYETADAMMLIENGCSKVMLTKRG